MSEDEIQAFVCEPYYREALRLREWDDLAKEASMPLPELGIFKPFIEQRIVIRNSSQQQSTQRSD